MSEKDHFVTAPTSPGGTSYAGSTETNFYSPRSLASLSPTASNDPGTAEKSMTFDDRSTSGKEKGKGDDGGGGKESNGSGSFGLTKDAKIPLCVKISFAVPNIANMILVVPVTIMINKYFSDYVGIPMSNLALVTAVARSIDFFVDPVVGWLSDNLSYSLCGARGRRIPLMLIGAPLSALTFFALFTPPPLANITVLTIWFALFYTIHGWVNCLWNIPYYALGAEIPASYDERTSLYAYLAGGAVVGLILGSTLLPLFLVIAEQAMQLVNDDQIKVVGYYMYITTLAVVVLTLPLIGICFLTENKLVNPVHNEFVPMMRRAMRNKPFMVVLPTYCVVHILLCLVSMMLPYLLEYVILTKGKNAEVWLSYSLIALEAGSVVGIPLWRWIAHYYGKSTPFMISWFCVVVVSTVAFFTAYPGMEIYFLVWMFLNGVSVGGWSFLFLAMQADVIDYDMLYTGDRREAQFITFWSLIPRLVIIPSSAIPLQILSWTGYVPNLLDQNVSTYWAIKVLGLLLPVLLALLCVVLMCYYPLSEDVLDKIEVGIKALQQDPSAIVIDPITNKVVDFPKSVLEKNRREYLDNFTSSELSSYLQQLNKGEKPSGLHAWLISKTIIIFVVSVVVLVAGIVIEWYFSIGRAIDIEGGVSVISVSLASFGIAWGAWEVIRMPTVLEFEETKYLEYSSDFLKNHLERIANECG